MTFEIFKLSQHPKVQTKRPQSVIGILDEKPEDDNYQNYDIDFWYRKTKSVVVTTIEIFQTILLYVFTAIIGEQQYSPKSEKKRNIVRTKMTLQLHRDKIETWSNQVDGKFADKGKTSICNIFHISERIQYILMSI